MKKKVVAIGDPIHSVVLPFFFFFLASGELVNARPKRVPGVTRAQKRTKRRAVPVFPVPRIPE
jgi:hypothetical protein